MQSIGSIKLGSGGVSWNKSGGGKEIKIPAKGQELPSEVPENDTKHVSIVQLWVTVHHTLAAYLITLVQ